MQRQLLDCGLRMNDSRRARSARTGSSRRIWGAMPVNPIPTHALFHSQKTAGASEGSHPLTAKSTRSSRAFRDEPAGAKRLASFSGSRSSRQFRVWLGVGMPKSMRLLSGKRMTKLRFSGLRLHINRWVHGWTLCRKLSNTTNNRSSATSSEYRCS